MRAPQTLTATAAALIAGLLLTACGGAAAGDDQSDSPTPTTASAPASYEYTLEHRCTDTGAGVACKASDAASCPSAIGARNVMRRGLDAAGKATGPWEKIGSVCNASEASKLTKQK